MNESVKKSKRKLKTYMETNGNENTTVFGMQQKQFEEVSL